VRLRPAPEPGPVLPPPLYLRRWDCARVPAGELTGRMVFAGAGEWRAARAAWRSTSGQTIGEWWAWALAEARAELRVLQLLPLSPGRDESVPGSW
jgi:hypothetical protein